MQKREKHYNNLWIDFKSYASNRYSQPKNIDIKTNYSNLSKNLRI
jgi:hypothetical protein